VKNADGSILIEYGIGIFLVPYTIDGISMPGSLVSFVISEGVVIIVLYNSISVSTKFVTVPIVREISEYLG
jgi:hypothetical protein